MPAATTLVPPWLQTAAVSLRTALTSATVTLTVALGALNVLTMPQPPAEELGLSATPMDRLLERHRCSVTGFAADVVPGSAVIVDAVGETRLVSFDHGWAVFNGDRPGRLVAVCLDRHQRPR